MFKNIYFIIVYIVCKRRNINCIILLYKALNGYGEWCTNKNLYPKIKCFSFNKFLFFLVMKNLSLRKLYQIKEVMLKLLFHNIVFLIMLIFKPLELWIHEHDSRTPDYLVKNVWKRCKNFINMYDIYIYN